MAPCSFTFPLVGMGNSSALAQLQHLLIHTSYKHCNCSSSTIKTLVETLYVLMHLLIQSPADRHYGMLMTLQLHVFQNCCNVFAEAISKFQCLSTAC